MSKVTDYKKLSDREHVLKRPNTYVGSIETSEEFAWIYSPDKKHMVWEKVQYNPGLYKIFDEAIVNARDAFVRSVTEADRLPVKTIDITVAVNNSDKPLTITVSNDGDGILIEEHPDEKIWLPEMIFGHLRTSSNYEDNDNNERIVGGVNGLGIKLVNLFSTYFKVEIKDVQNKKSYCQQWRDNMSVCEKPTISKGTGKGLVSVSFTPDMKYFCKASGGSASEEFINDTVRILHTRAISLAAVVGNKAKVSWNGEVISTNTFEKYTKLFLRDGATSIAYENCGPRWEVASVLSSQLYTDDEHGMPPEKNVSFVNGIWTRKGGKHVEYVSKHILTDICALAQKKKKLEIKPGQIKDSIVFFVNSTIANPEFTSQCKEELTTNATKFGSKPEFTGKLVDGLVKLGALDEAVAIHEAKTMRDAKKTDGKKRSVVRGMTKLIDAQWAGTAKSKECTLILTEGDSAATSAISGLSIVGREKWGVFPLRGKLLNVRDITVQKFNANEELTSIKRILGLEHGKQYKDISELRYGRVMIMADQDHDGSHIKGLLMNLFHAEWPGLLKSGFLCTLLTPILKASKGSKVISFYSIPEFNQWKDSNSTHGWKIKYYKGLGTSTPAEAKEWFKDLQEIGYEWDDNTDDSINLAFNKKRADDRKKWLSKYDPTKMLTVKDKRASYTNFVNDELIHFSNADNIRSLPHLVDGLKPSQRKILYCCFKRNLKEDIKVAQLAGYVSEHAGYHHGEASLNSTIVGMAQDFVGACNINLLMPNGQFGSRVHGGSDAASERYIFTRLESIVDTIFRKEDACLLKHLDDDGDIVEPEYYLPTVPLLAINGCIGIGTGFSTDVPPHKPDDIVSLIQHRLLGNIDTLADRPLDPWWFGFKGKTLRTDEQTWITKGLYEFDDTKHTITITELPVGTWSHKYKEFLDKVCENEERIMKGAKKEAKKAETASKASSTKSVKEEEPCGLKSFDDLYDDVNVKFVLYLTEDAYDAYKYNVEKFEKKFKLTSSWKTTNMHCFDTKFNIKKYKTVGDILEEFVQMRLPQYEARRLSILKTLQKQIVEMSAKRAFLQAILDGRLVIMRKSDEEIVEGLKECGIPALSCPEKPDEVESYEFVLKMRIDRVKASAIAQFDKEIGELRVEIERLEKETASSLWLADLEDFKNAWTKYSEIRAEKMSSSFNEGADTKKPIKRKRIAVKGA